MLAIDDGTRPPLSRARIWNMCCGLFGVQVVWGLQNVNTSRIFQTLGASVDGLAILWIAAPVTGLVVQPLIGHLSDRTWGPLGRRRPYLLGGALLTALALLAMPNASTIWMASLMLWLLTGSINVAAEPFRALVADSLPEAQQTTGFAIQTFFIGLGAVLASALPWMLAHWGVSGVGPRHVLPPTVRIAFYVGAAFLLVAVTWSILTTSERPPEAIEAENHRTDMPAAPTREGETKLIRSGLIWIAAGVAVGGFAFAEALRRGIYIVAALAAMFGMAQLMAVLIRRRGGASVSVLEIVEDILHMPLVLKRLAVVQFFTWFGLFAMWVYTVPAIAAQHYGSADPSSVAYNQCADWVGVLFAGYNGVAAIVALALPPLAARVGRRAVHAIALLLGALGLLGFVLIDDPIWLWLPTIGIGCAWASILSTAYAMLSSALPPRKIGVYMGIHNIFLVLPQLVAATLLDAMVARLFWGHAIYALALAAGSLALAAAFTLTVPDQTPRR
jgi:maltose/moltooligosaccharide transporter